MNKFFFLFTIISVLFPFEASHPRSAHAAQPAAAEVVVLNRDGKAITRLTDGDTLRLRLTLSEKTSQPTPIVFRLAGSQQTAAGCSIAQGQSGCETEAFASLGWYWDEQGAAQPERTVEALTGGSLVGVSAPLQIAGRPGVMVAGFWSDWGAGGNYLGATGYLAKVGLPGFAVGDGQVPGAMNTGSLADPTGRTHTISQNAAILGEYIATVKKLTGAERIDLLAHSMGGLISRYYIDRVMPDGEAVQLMMLGSPMAGTSCANLPGSLGFYLPATLEIMPSYIEAIFNPQITRRRGVIFRALAGVPIVEAVASPCSPVPSDIVVPQQSVEAIPLLVQRMPILHTDLNTSEQIFQEFVLPNLQLPAGSLQPQPDPEASARSFPPVQFTRLYSGHLAAGETRDLVINIESNVAVASFSLYDHSRSLSIEVRGASGNVIQLDPGKNGLIQVDDPASMVYLGYGFENPKPGAWQVKLQTTAKTPAAGADYALTAVFQGGAALSAQASTVIPEPNQPVQLSLRLELGGQPLPIDRAQALIRKPDGSSETLDFTPASGAQPTQLEFTPAQSGLYGIQISASGVSPDDFLVERSTFLVIEAQPPRARTYTSAVLMGGGLAALLIVMVAGVRWRRARKVKPRP